MSRQLHLSLCLRAVMLHLPFIYLYTSVPFDPLSSASHLLCFWSDFYLLTVLSSFSISPVPRYCSAFIPTLLFPFLDPSISVIKGDLEGCLGSGHKGPLSKAMTHFQVKRTFVM